MEAISRLRETIWLRARRIRQEWQTFLQQRPPVTPTNQLPRSTPEVLPEQQGVTVTLG